MWIAFSVWSHKDATRQQHQKNKRNCVAKSSSHYEERESENNHLAYIVSVVYIVCCINESPKLYILWIYSSIKRFKLSAFLWLRSFVDTTSPLPNFVVVVWQGHGMGLLECNGHRSRSFAPPEHPTDLGAHGRRRSHHRTATVRTAANAVRLLQPVSQSLQQSVSQPMFAGQSVSWQSAGNAVADARPWTDIGQRVLEAYVDRTAGQSTGRICE